MANRVMAAATLVLCACAPAPSPRASTSPTATAAASPTTAFPSPSASAATPSPAPAQPRPATTAVSFAGLPAGTYPVHLHSVCSGAQSFHVTVLQSLTVRGGEGVIQVPSGYFGRSLCVIVYASPALSRVLATRPI